MCYICYVLGYRFRWIKMCVIALVFSTPAFSLPHFQRPPIPCYQVQQTFYQPISLEKLSSIEERSQTDRITAPTRARLCRCRWPRWRTIAIVSQRLTLTATLTLTSNHCPWPMTLTVEPMRARVMTNSRPKTSSKAKASRLKRWSGNKQTERQVNARVATRPVFDGTSRFSANLSRVPLD